MGDERSQNGVVELTLYKLNYTEPNAWSDPMSTGRPNEVMATLTQRVRL